MLVIENILRYKLAKNYQNRPWFDKVVAKIKCCSFCDSHRYYYYYYDDRSVVM